ncbi:unnamed protein product [Pylaiella littoralis]
MPSATPLERVLAFQSQAALRSRPLEDAEARPFVST